ncbi:MAG: hypothetical protein IJU76_05575 [Desulfovibrionaceae bacterium]|nr:hypothetical protein [Desulfovibrionaceae bacterium]
MPENDFSLRSITFIVYRALFDEKALKMTNGSTLLFPIGIYYGDLGLLSVQ